AGAALLAGTWPRGHLPWPAVEWALTTPLAALAVTAAGAVSLALPFLALQANMAPRQSLARAIDVTGMPPWMWPQRPPLRPGETSVERWLGQPRRAQQVSLALLGGTALLGLLLVASLVAALAWGLLEVRVAFLGHECGAHGCPPLPPLYPVFLIAAGSEIAAGGLIRLASYRWLHRVEVSSGVWLRYRVSLWATPLSYVRRPGVTPEAAAVALRRFAPVREVPLARVLALAVLATTPLVLLLSASIILQGWVQ